MAGIDSNTKLMLHCNGDDESTTFVDDSPSEHVVTAHGTAQLDTSVKKFGSASGSFDGDSDYLTIPDSDDWNIFNSTLDDWTIDLWVKFGSLDSNNHIFLSQRVDNDNRWLFFHDLNGIRFYYKQTTTLELNIYKASNAISDTNWHHICFIKKGTACGLYQDGTQIAYGTISGTINLGANLYIGDDSLGRYFDGYKDEIRIQNSNYFSANPVVGLTDTIVVPTSEYSEEVVGGSRNQAIIIIG